MTLPNRPGNYATMAVSSRSHRVSELQLVIVHMSGIGIRHGVSYTFWWAGSSCSLATDGGPARSTRGVTWG